MKPELPREHGAWGLLATGLLAGLLLGGWRGPGPAALYLILAVAGFLPERPLEARLRGRPFSPGALVLPLAIVILAALALLLGYHRYGLILWGSLILVLYGYHLYQKAHRQERTLGGEVLGVGGLAALGAGALYAGTGRLSLAVVYLFLLLWLHFGLGVQYVRWRIRRPAGAYRGATWAHVLAVAGVLGLGLLDQVPRFTFLAYLPALGRLLWAGPQVGKPRVKALGWQEVGYSLVFLVLLVLAYRLSSA